MQLKPLYTVRFRYPEAWDADLTGPGGTEEFNFLFAEGHCTGRLSGRFAAPTTRRVAPTTHKRWIF